LGFTFAVAKPVVLYKKEKGKKKIVTGRERNRETER
jgi:hypothetical protein